MQWWHDHDEDWTERDDMPPRHLLVLAQLILGVLIATAIIVYIAS